MKNRIINGDCTKVLKTFPAESVDFVLTDPPYLAAYKDCQGRTLANDDKPEVIIAAFAEIYRVLKPHSFCVSFYGWVAIDTFAAAWKNAGFSAVGHILWPKSYVSSRRFLEHSHEAAFLLAKGRPAKPDKPLKDVQDTWDYSGNKDHPTEKVIGVLKPVIEAFTAPGDVVLDPFSGSGSTSVAAALARRRFIGIEVEQKYCQLAEKRLAGVARHMARTP